MTLKLYNFPQSTCSQKVRLVLWEKGLDFLDRPVNSKQQEHLSDWYLKLNPNGVVPTLIHSDSIIVDSSVIMEYLDEVFPTMPLTLEDPVKRAHMRKWMRYFEEVPTLAIRVPSFNKYLSKRFDKLTQEQFDDFVDTHPIRKQFFKKMRKEKGFDDFETELAVDRLNQTIRYMENGLAKSGGLWLMGERLTLADFCIAPTIDRMIDLGLSQLLETHPFVGRWYENITKLESYNKTYYRGTRLSEIYDGKEFNSCENQAEVVVD
jgi:glutathione S-transferase